MSSAAAAAAGGAGAPAPPAKKKKGLSVEEKRQVMLEIILGSGDVFSIKELEKEGKGLIGSLKSIRPITSNGFFVDGSADKTSKLKLPLDGA